MFCCTYMDMEMTHSTKSKTKKTKNFEKLKATQSTTKRE